MNRSKKKGCLVVVLMFLLLIVFLYGGIRYKTCYAKNKVLSEVSHDGQYELLIYMIGEPDWPFGSAHCRFDLIKSGKRVIKYPFDVCSDGAFVHADNFHIVWNTDNVTVTVSGEEQDDKVYILYFDGSVPE